MHSTASIDKKLQNAMALVAAGRLATAEVMLGELYRAAPQLPAVAANYATLLSRLGRPDEAERVLAAAVSRNPRDAILVGNLGALAAQRGDFDRAMALFQQAVKLRPWPDTLINLGKLALLRGHVDVAESAFAKALKLQPGHGPAMYGIARVEQQRGNLRRALELYELAMQRAPRDVDNLTEFAEAMRQFDDAAKAEAISRRALELAPAHLGARIQLGLALSRQKRGDEAATELEACWARDSSNENLLLALVSNLRAACDWDRLARYEPELVERVNEPSTVRAKSLGIFRLNYFEKLGPTLVRDLAERECARIESQTSAASPTLKRHPGRGGRLRLGYLLSDVGDHPNGRAALALFEHHDRERVELFVYSRGASDGSSVRQRTEAAAEHFVDVAGGSDFEIAQKIADDGVEILIDLMGHTQGGSLAALALRPAPVQITYLGYPGTTGARFIDYILGDAIVTPTEDSAQFTERILQLPHCYLPALLPAGRPALAPTRASLGLPDDAFVYCSISNPNKITAKRFSSWMRVLQQVPRSVIWLGHGSDAVRARLAEQAPRHGVDPGRLVFAPFEPDREAFLARLQAADLFLDTAPYGAHSTAIDALWAGLPVLTVRGRGFASRVTSSVLATAGQHELIVDDEAGFERKAVELGTTAGAIDALKAQLHREHDTSPLFDMAAKTRALENLLEPLRIDHRASPTHDA